MTVNTFLIRINQLFLGIFLLFFVDQLLPKVTNKGKIISSHSPLDRHQYGKSSPSREEHIIDTSVGRIKVYVKDLVSIDLTSDILLYSTPILNSPSKIKFLKNSKEVQSGNILLTYFMFLPTLAFVLSIVTVFSKDQETILNIGSTNILIAVTTIYFLFKDYFR